jgi:hypothetical protein
LAAFRACIEMDAMTPPVKSRDSSITRRGRTSTRKWKSEYIPADDPFARFAAMAQRALVRRMIAANRSHWRKHDTQLARKRAATERVAESHQSAP